MSADTFRGYVRRVAREAERLQTLIKERAAVAASLPKPDAPRDDPTPTPASASNSATAQPVAQSPPPPVVVAFFDELNTAPETTLALAKEVFLDGSLDGQPLPQNIFWTAAINPDARMSAATVNRLPASPASSSIAAAPPVAPQAGSGADMDTELADFVVRPLPVSLTHLLLDYHSLTEAQEREFIAAYLRGAMGSATPAPPAEAVAASCDAPAIAFDDAAFAGHLRALILQGQDYVRSAQLWRTHVSIRDMLRAVRLYRTLLEPEHRDVLLPNAPAGPDREERLHWYACIIAVALAYLLRLPPEHRTTYAGRVDDRLASLGAPDLRCNDVLSQALSKLYDSTAVPEGIARCSALQENLYACVVCLVANVPLNITGP